MAAILLSLETFANDLSGKSVLILSDNVSVVAYINMHGGPSRNLTNIATKIWSFMVQNQIEAKLKHLRRKNYVADQLSRYSSEYDWMLFPNIFRYLDTLWRPHTCDRFASHLLAQCIKYDSIHADQASSGIIELVQMDWDK